MVNVSDNFIELARQSGRRVSCKIIADGVELLDDRITGMSFDDVIHPDWFTLGTTCANRLHFTARYSGELSANAEVRAYISFDGEEWCPLGIFYITRRYVKGGSISVTAYDRMYSLNTDYVYEGELPVNSQTLLKDVCEKAGLETAETGNSYTIEKVPEGYTVRDMLGYIAGINYSCAKIDREGRLVMKRTYTPINFELEDKSCTDIQRNMESTVFTNVKIYTGDAEITSGSGSEMSKIEIFNPLGSQEIADVICSVFKPFSFYGARLQMQGMPFLEAGDTISFLDGKLLYRLVASEIEYSYNGGLTATLYSRNHVHEEDSDDLERLITELMHKDDTVHYMQTNESQIAIKSDPQIIADFEPELTDNYFAQLDVNFTAKQSTADFLVFGINVNGIDIERKYTQSMGENDYEIIHLYHFEEKLPTGSNRVYVTAQTKTGDAYIEAGNMLATLVGHRIYESAEDAGGDTSFSDRAGRWSEEDYTIELREAAAEPAATVKEEST